MSNDIKLNSAAAIEVASFCWPGQKWQTLPQSDLRIPLHRAGSAFALVDGRISARFCLDDFNDLHRAAAVLDRIGHGQRLGVNLAIQCGFDGKGLTHFMKLAKASAAPADAWARAILQTVREVSK